MIRGLIGNDKRLREGKMSEKVLKILEDKERIQ